MVWQSSQHNTTLSDYWRQVLLKCCITLNCTLTQICIQFWWPFSRWTWASSRPPPRFFLHLTDLSESVWIIDPIFLQAGFPPVTPRTVSKLWRELRALKPTRERHRVTMIHQVTCCSVHCSCPTFERTFVGLIYLVCVVCFTVDEVFCDREIVLSIVHYRTFSPFELLFLGHLIPRPDPNRIGLVSHP